MVAVGMERCDEIGRVVVKGIVLRDGEEEVLLYVFFLWAPDLLTMFIDDGVLMRVIGDGSGTKWGSEEMREELGFWGDGEQEVREDRSEQGGGGDNGDGGFNDGQWEVFYRNVSKGDSLDNFFELEVDICVLMFGGQGVLKLGA
jgi:hypothetical protein